MWIASLTLLVCQFLSIDKLYFVPKRIMVGLVGVL